MEALHLPMGRDTRCCLAYRAVVLYLYDTETTGRDEPGKITGNRKVLLSVTNPNIGRERVSRHTCILDILRPGDRSFQRQIGSTKYR